MKKCWLLLFTCFLLNQMYAQKFSLGVKAGPNFSKFTSDINYKSIDRATSFHLGGFANAKFLGYLAQAELLLDQRKGRFNFRGDSNATINLYYCDVPVLFGYSFLGIGRVYAGPNFTLLLGANRKASFKNSSFDKSVFNSAPVAGIIGIGVDVWRLTFDCRFDFSITKIGNELITNYGKIDYGKRVNMFQVSVGYKLIKL